MNLFHRLHSEEGANLVEYALLIVLVALVAIVAIAFAGNEVSNMWSEIGSSLDT